MIFTTPRRTLVPENVNQKYVIPARRESRKQQVNQSYDKRARQLPKLKSSQNVYFEHRTMESGNVVI